MTDTVELTYRQRALLIRFVGTMIVAVCLLFAALIVSSYQTRVDIVKTQRIGCERGKRDRIDNAAAWTAHRVYITKVTGAKSVQEDVKRAARTAIGTYVRVSNGLTRRSRISCKAAFPDPPVLKFVGSF